MFVDIWRCCKATAW